MEELDTADGETSEFCPLGEGGWSVEGGNGMKIFAIDRVSPDHVLSLLLQAVMAMDSIDGSRTRVLRERNAQSKSFRDAVPGFTCSSSRL